MSQTTFRPPVVSLRNSSWQANEGGDPYLFENA